MRVSAKVRNGGGEHEASVASDGRAKPVAIPPKASGPGSSLNGGELLVLALATCYCNDVYREAARLGIAVDSVEVEASAHFDGVGLAARDVRYRARVASRASTSEIERLLTTTDRVAEIQNTLRAGPGVTFETWHTDDRQTPTP